MTKLEMLVELYGYSRQQGHTTAMLEGARASKAVIIVADSRQKRMFVTTQLRAITLDELDNLRGYRGPILVDHYALQMAFWDHEEQKKQEMTTADMYKELVDAGWKSVHGRWFLESFPPEANTLTLEMAYERLKRAP